MNRGDRPHALPGRDHPSHLEREREREERESGPDTIDRGEKGNDQTYHPLSESGIGNYVIVDLAKTATDAIVPHDLPHGIADVVGAQKTAIEFKVDEADDEDHAGDAYRRIVHACRKHADVMRGAITLVVDGETETTSIG